MEYTQSSSPCVVLCRTFPQLLFMEQSLRTGVQPEAARSIVAPVMDTFAGVRTVCGAAHSAMAAAAKLMQRQ